jgi:hypothetical protein
MPANRCSCSRTTWAFELALRRRRDMLEVAATAAAWPGVRTGASTRDADAESTSTARPRGGSSPLSTLRDEHPNPLTLEGVPDEDHAHLRAVRRDGRRGQSGPDLDLDRLSDHGSSDRRSTLESRRSVTASCAAYADPRRMLLAKNWSRSARCSAAFDECSWKGTRSP